MGPYRQMHQPKRTEGKAILSFALGLLSVCTGGVTGLPAMMIGAVARRDIDRSNGTLGGGVLAASGIVTGLFGTGLGLVVLLWAAGSVVGPALDNTTAYVPMPAVTAPSQNPPPDEAPPGVILSSSGTHTYGSLEVVDLDDSRPLRTQLAEVQRRAHGRTVVVQTYVKSSLECAAIAAALPDLRMQRALANVTLVRVDVDEYERELASMKVETTSAPWFYKLDAKGAPADKISAAAWKANVPENMAPVLGNFVRRRTSRR